MIKLIFKIIKLLIFILILLTLSVFAYQKGWLKNHPLHAQIENFQSGEIKNWQDFISSFQDQEKLNLQLNELSNDAGKQIKISAQKALEAGKVAQEFMSESVQTDEFEDKKIGEKAFEYGQYIYCKAVVDDWQERLIEDNSEKEEDILDQDEIKTNE
jgi:hypothetical protein